MTVGYTYKIYHKIFSTSEWTESIELVEVGTYEITGLLAYEEYDITISSHAN